MAPNQFSKLVIMLLAIMSTISLISGHSSTPPLTLDYYKSSCPHLESIVRREMECAVLSDPRNAAIIVRLHMHDCFVQGCDGSVLLEDTVTLTGEKKASQNKHSLRGFKLMDKIKMMVESECPGVVSCADILTLAARDAVILVGGPYWDVPLGRKDARSTNRELVDGNIPGPSEGLVSMISKFAYQGLSVTDMVALSGAHTIGMARCENFRARIYGDFGETSEKDPMSTTHLNNLRSVCPAVGGNNNVSALDYETPDLFDNSYFQLLIKGQGLLNSDQELYSSLLGIQTRHLVHKYAEDVLEFFKQFAESMVKMGNITNADSFATGEIRNSCRFVNSLRRTE